MPGTDDKEVIITEAAATAPESGATAATEDANDGTQAGGDEQAQDDQEEPRTFTQEELDAAISKRVAKAERALRREWETRAAEAQRPANGNPPTRDLFPVGDDGDQAYWDASVDYVSDQKLMQREQQKQQTSVKTAYQEREEAVRDKYPDFDVAYKHPSEGGPAISQLMADVIRKSEHGPELFYHLGKNVNESHRICGMDPIDQVRELTRLEAKVAANPSVRKVSSAPEPIKPIAGAAPTPVKYSTTDPRSIKTMSDSEWIAAENNRRAKLAKG